jgi:hypothetical protein
MRNAIHRIRIDWPSFFACLATAAAWAVLAVIFVRHAVGQTLAPVAPATAAASSGPNWWLYGGIGAAVLVLVLCVIGFLRFRKRNPEGAAKVQAATIADAQAIGHAIAAAADSAVDRLLAVRITSPGATGTGSATGMGGVVLAPLTEALPISGKFGQAGPLTVQCVGEPKADQAAFNEKYFG